MKTLSQDSLPRVRPSNAQRAFHFVLWSSEWEYPSVSRGRDHETQQGAEAACLGFKAAVAQESTDPAYPQSHPSSLQATGTGSQAITARPQEQTKWLRITQMPAQMRLSSEICFTPE